MVVVTSAPACRWRSRSAGRAALEPVDQPRGLRARPAMRSAGLDGTMTATCLGWRTGPSATRRRGTDRRLARFRFATSSRSATGVVHVLRRWISRVKPQSVAQAGWQWTRNVAQLACRRESLLANQRELHRAARAMTCPDARHEADPLASRGAPDVGPSRARAASRCPGRRRCRA